MARFQRRTVTPNLSDLHNLHVHTEWLTLHATMVIEQCSLGGVLLNSYYKIIHYY